MTIRVPCCDRHPRPTEKQVRDVRQKWPTMKIEEFFKSSLEGRIWKRSLKFRPNNLFAFSEIEARINEAKKARENNPNYALNNKLPISVLMEQVIN